MSARFFFCLPFLVLGSHAYGQGCLNGAGPQFFAANVSSFAGFGGIFSQPTPTLQELAKQSFSSPQRDSDNCHPSRHPSLPQQIPLARRARRRKPPTPLQPVVLTEEQRAAARYELAHQLWLNGNNDAARRWLAELADKWPNTAVADRARVTLAKL